MKASFKQKRTDWSSPLLIKSCLRMQTRRQAHTDTHTHRYTRARAHAHAHTHSSPSKRNRAPIPQNWKPLSVCVPADLSPGIPAVAPDADHAGDSGTPASAGTHGLAGSRRVDARQGRASPPQDPALQTRAPRGGARSGKVSRGGGAAWASWATSWSLGFLGNPQPAWSAAASFFWERTLRVARGPQLLRPQLLHPLWCSLQSAAPLSTTSIPRAPSLCVAPNGSGTGSWGLKGTGRGTRLFAYRLESMIIWPVLTLIISNQCLWRPEPAWWGSSDSISVWNPQPPGEAGRLLQSDYSHFTEDAQKEKKKLLKMNGNMMQAILNSKMELFVWKQS